MKGIKKVKSVALSWGDSSPEIKVSQQNSMTDFRNPYEHLNEDKSSKSKDDVSGKYVVIPRGDDNHAPQKDLQLGKRSITHKKIAEKLAQLVQGMGIEFYIKEDSTESSLAELELEEAQKWVDELGLDDAIDMVSNGMVYQNLSSIVINQKVSFNNVTKRVSPYPIAFNSYPSEYLRFSQRKMTSSGKIYNEHHFYNETWGFTGVNKKGKTPEIVPIKKYIELINSDKLNNEAFAVLNIENEKSPSEDFVSCEVSMSDNIFDNAYPLASWKANSSINDIQSEFESSCIRIDYLRNGLHIFAVVNIYSATYNTTTENADETLDESWAEDLAIVQSLKGSYNSGRIIVNPLGTDDPNLDGKIVVEKIELSFPVEQVKYFNEEARSGILTAWGVDADLFSITKPEKSNLRSQEGYLKIVILKLQELVRIYQHPIEKRVNYLLKYYGFTEIKARMIKQDNSLFLTVLAELAKDKMPTNEFRKLVLGLEELEDEELDKMLKSVSTTTQSSAPNIIEEN
jgi:hypothetical protein